MKKKILIAVIIVLILGGGFIFIKTKNAAQTAMSQGIPVKVMETKPETITTFVNADGNVVANQEQDVKARINGLVEEVYVEVGDELRKGEEVLKIDEQVLENTLAAAKLSLREAEKNYQNLLGIYQGQDKLNNLKLEEAERNLEIAKLSLEKEKINLGNQKLNAEQRVAKAEEELAKAADELEKNKYLYENGAIPEKSLTASQEVYQQSREELEKAQSDLKLLVSETIPNALKLARLQVENAENKLATLIATLDRENISETDLELARIKIEKAEKQVEEIREDLRKITAYTPLTGTVVEINVKQGDKVMEGTTVARIADVKDLIIEAMVDEIHINQVAVRQNVMISSDSFSEELQGQVLSIAPVATKVGNVNKYKTRIQLLGSVDVVKPGMFVNTEITTNSREDIIAVPVLSVMGEKERFVYLYQDGKAVKREVELGLKNLTRVEIKGVKTGEKVIIGPFTALQKLKPGSAVFDLDQADRQAGTSDK